MKLDDLCTVIDRGDFPVADARDDPTRDTVLAARAAVTEAVRDDDFLLDCVALELDLLQQRIFRGGLVPFFTMPRLGIGFSFGYWWPGSRAGAHEHTAWTITAVCRNELTVQTYDRDQSYRQRRLIPKNRFEATAGSAGFIYDPCIHNPSNTSERWSISLHLYSPRDGRVLDDYDHACLPMLTDMRAARSALRTEPYRKVLEARHRQLVIGQIAELLAETTGDTSDRLLRRCAEMGSTLNRRFVDGLGRVTPAHSTAPPPSTLAVVDDGLALTTREFDGSVALGVETSRGWIEELRMDRIAAQAMVFASRTSAFTVHEMPGRLTSDERWSIAGALEQSGLFEMVAD